MQQQLQFLLEVFTPTNMLWMAIASIVGAILGFLPGLGPTNGIAMFLPITFNMDAGTGLIVLSAIYVSGSFAGNITAVLMSTPGTSDSLFMVFDGYPMTVQGKAARALGITTISSFIGGIIGAAALITIAPALAKIALRFGPMEMFLTTMLGITIIVGLCRADMSKGLASASLGLLCTLVGTDKYSGIPRFDWGIQPLMDSMPLIPVTLGLFAVSQMFVLIHEGNETITQNAGATVSGSTWIPMRELMPKMVNILRSSIIGTVVGIIPAAGSTVACGLSYDLQKKFDKHPETFGKGNENGLAAVSAANNAVVGGSLVPLITLSIPGNGTAAIFLSGLLIHGLTPGYELFTTHMDECYVFLWGMLICQLWILVEGLWGGKYLAKLTVLPNSVLVPMIGVFCMMGSYTGRFINFDMYIDLVFGIAGYIMCRTGVPLAPFVLAFVLGSTMEKQLRRSLTLLSANWLKTMTTPLCMILLLCNVALLLWPAIETYRENKAKKAAK